MDKRADRQTDGQVNFRDDLLLKIIYIFDKFDIGQKIPL